MQSLKMQIIWCSRAQYALWTCIIAVFAIFYGTRYQPLAGNLRALDATVAQTRRELSDGQLQVRQIPRAQAELTELRSKITEAQKLPSTPELGNFMQQMRQISNQSDLHNLNVSFPGSYRKIRQLTEVPVALRFEGNFLSIFNALARTEQLPRLTRISNIAIHNIDSTTGSVRVEVSLNLYFAEGT